MIAGGVFLYCQLIERSRHFFCLVLYLWGNKPEDPSLFFVFKKDFTGALCHTEIGAADTDQGLQDRQPHAEAEPGLDLIEVRCSRTGPAKRVGPW